MAKKNTFESQVIAIQFTKDGHQLLSHLQQMPTNPGEEPKTRWLFNMQQIAQQNMLTLPKEKENEEYHVYSEEDRDQLAEKILDAVIAGRKKADELMEQVQSAFADALPVGTPEEPNPAFEG